MQDNPVYADVVAEVLEYLRIRRDALLAAGIEQDRIALDPGIGFGKTTEHNLQLLRQRLAISPARLPSADRPFAQAFPGRPPTPLSASQTPATDARPPQNTDEYAPSDRTAGTIGVALSLARQGVQILRVHDVAAVREALLLFQAAGGLLLY